MIEKLVDSKLYRDYERAFNTATGMPVALRPVASWQLPHRSKRNENPFCAIMAGKSRSCAACLRTQQKLADAARTEPQSVTCAHGMTDTAVPVRVGDKLIGYLQTGQIFRTKPTESRFERSARLASDWGVPANRATLREAYFATKTVNSAEHTSMVTMLHIFAQHLALITNQIFLQEANSEPPLITRAKAFIQQNMGERLSLGRVAKSVNTSNFYFCKVFKRYTGLHFTEYVSRVRIEKTKNLLLNPNLRISEIAYAVGFESLTHFNRVFGRIVGQPPTEYRAKLKGA